MVSDFKFTIKTDYGHKSENTKFKIFQSITQSINH